MPPYLIAPNGKPSNLTPEQYKLVRTSAFKKWFGDWENDPANASRVVDENGEPKVMYHGARAKFNVFENNNENKLDWTIGGNGFYFTSLYYDAYAYAENVLACFIKSNYVLSDGHEHAFVNDYLLQKIKSYGADGIYFDGERLNTQGKWVKVPDELVVFNSNQIKLANGTNTTFDGNNPDIRYAGGGDVNNIFDYQEDSYEPKKYGEVLYTFKNENEDEFNVSLTNINKKEKSVVLDFEGNYSWNTFKNNNPFKTLRTLSSIIKYAIKKLSNDGFIIKTIIYDATEKKSKIYQLMILKEFPNAKFKINQFGSDEVKLYGNNTDIRFEKGGLIAPNGKRSGLYFTEIYNLVRTKEFKEWFGDWEEAYKTKDYEGVSKIIDENGEPLICVHNTPNEFYEFDEYEIGRTTDAGFYGRGFYFTPNIGQSRYGEIELNCFLNIKNPYFKKHSHRNYELNSDELKNQGYDGVVVYSNFIEDFNYENGVGWKNHTEEIVAYYPEQIKLGDGRNTKFDSYNPDIRFSKGGDINNKIVIRKIRQKDIPEITRNLAQVFDKSGWTANQLWNTIGYIDPNLSVVAEYNNQLAGFYFLNPNDIPRMYGIVSRFDGKKGVEGVALGVFKKFKNKGIGKKLIEYSQNNLDYDYIWGYQMKVLDNINDWLKRREIYQEYSNMYITYQMLK